MTAQPPQADNGKEKRPAEAGRRTGDAISGGAGRKLAPSTQSVQEENRAETRVVTYLDGFNLYFGLKSKNWRRYYWLDVHALGQALLKPGQKLVGTKYFTSRDSSTPRDPHKAQRQGTYLEALEHHPDVKVTFGHYLPKKRRCHQCGSSWQTFEEKQTDVNIAVSMLADCHADQFDMALLISADSDLTSPIREIHRLFPEKNIIVAFPPGRRSDQLRCEADGCFTIGESKFRHSQLPDPVIKPDGYALKRPTQWR